MRKTFGFAAATALAGGVLVTGPATAVVADPAPPPLSAFKEGQPIPAGSGKLPFCGPGTGVYVLIVEKRAVVVGGSGNYVQEILSPGQKYSYSDPATGHMVFNNDGTSMTYSRPGKTDVTEVCKPRQ